ncbi:hypothetical protein [Dapis sp. BLCC M172]|uniref:hypothetical protein n=1 Tax=Dapis sp. BLCC M172 TaxID=2975281 RepID=UPI003CEE083E
MTPVSSTPASVIDRSDFSEKLRHNIREYKLLGKYLTIFDKYGNKATCPKFSV